MPRPRTPHHVRTYALAALAATACSAYMPAPMHPQRVVWDHPPRIGSGPALRSLTESAVRSWGAGEYVGDCSTADVCLVLTTGQLGPEGDALGLATWDTREMWCAIGIRLPDLVVVQHEIGHCLGLAHSPDHMSVMYPTLPSRPGRPMRWQTITAEDRAAVREMVPVAR